MNYYNMTSNTRRTHHLLTMRTRLLGALVHKFHMFLKLVKGKSCCCTNWCFFRSFRVQEWLATLNAALVVLRPWGEGPLRLWGALTPILSMFVRNATITDRGPYDGLVEGIGLDLGRSANFSLRPWLSQLLSHICMSVYIVSPDYEYRRFLTHALFLLEDWYSLNQIW